MYLHAVKQGLRLNGNIIITTDIPEIDSHALPEACILHRRDAYLSTDTTSMSAVIHDVIIKHNLNNKTIVLLQVTSPLRSDKDVLSCLDLFMTGKFSMVMSVVQARNDILKYGTLSQDQTFSNVVHNSFCFLNRQDLPRTYKPNGAIYVFNSDSFLKTNNFPFDQICVIEMPEDRSSDIDTLDDFVHAERIMDSATHHDL